MPRRYGGQYHRLADAIKRVETAAPHPDPATCKNECDFCDDEEQADDTDDGAADAQQ